MGRQQPQEIAFDQPADHGVAGDRESYQTAHRDYARPSILL